MHKYLQNMKVDKMMTFEAQLISCISTEITGNRRGRTLGTRSNDKKFKQ